MKNSLIIILMALAIFACEKQDDKALSTMRVENVTFYDNVFTSDYPQTSLWTVAEHSNSGMLKIQYLPPYDHMEDQYVGYNLVFGEGVKDSLMLVINEEFLYYKIEQIDKGLYLRGDPSITLKLY